MAVCSAYANAAVMAAMIILRMSDLQVSIGYC
jgi:hypothetical protein